MAPTVVAFQNVFSEYTTDQISSPRSYSLPVPRCFEERRVYRAHANDNHIANGLVATKIKIHAQTRPVLGGVFKVTRRRPNNHLQRIFRRQQ